MSVVRGTTLLIAFLAVLLLASPASAYKIAGGLGGIPGPTEVANNCLNAIPPILQPESCVAMVVDFVRWAVNEVLGPIP